eukprot:3680618-Prymnesium_polylepis.2
MSAVDLATSGAGCGGGAARAARAAHVSAGTFGTPVAESRPSVAPSLCVPRVPGAKIGCKLDSAYVQISAAVVCTRGRLRRARGDAAAQATAAAFGL